MPAANPELEKKAEEKGIEFLKKWFTSVSHVSKERYLSPIDAYVYDGEKKIAVEIKSSTQSRFGLPNSRYDRIIDEINCHFLILLICPRGLMFYDEQTMLKDLLEKEVCYRTYPKDFESRFPDKKLMRAIS